MTARLPTPGGDDGTWGDTLNTFLEVGHDSTGNNIGAVVEVSKSADYTLTTEEAGKRVICTASLTLLIPSVGTLGAGFECEVINDSGGSVTIDGPGSTNITLVNGDIATIIEANNKQWVVKGAGTVIS